MYKRLTGSVHRRPKEQHGRSARYRLPSSRRNAEGGEKNTRLAVVAGLKVQQPPVQIPGRQAAPPTAAHWPFSGYHILQHIPILLISGQFLQGYLSTWREGGRGEGGCGAVSRYGIGSVPLPPLWFIVNRLAFMPNRATRGYQPARVCVRRGNQAAGAPRISFCVALRARRGATGRWRCRVCVCVTVFAFCVVEAGGEKKKKPSGFAIEYGCKKKK